MKTIYLVRHAQSHPSAEVPDPEWPLSERGRAQALRLAHVLGELGIEEVHTSPYLRCRDTIAPFVASAGVPLHEHRDLRERRIALGLIDDFAQVWRRSWDDFGFALPGCETSQAAQARVHAAITEICAGTAATTLAISSHGAALSLLLNRLDGSFHFERASAMRNPDVFCLRVDDSGLRWDATWRAAALDDFATHHDDTPFPRPRR